MKKEFSKYLLKSCNWLNVITVINNLPAYLNERERRFDKSKIIQDCIEMHSNGKLKFVGEVGFDFYITDKNSKFDNLKVELKSGKHMFTTQGKYNLKKPTAKTSNIILNNSNGSSLDKKYKKTYDFLLLVDISGFATVTWEEVLPHAKNAGAGFKASLPLELLAINQIVDGHTVHKVSSPIQDYFKRASLDTIKDIIKNARPI